MVNSYDQLTKFANVSVCFIFNCNFWVFTEFVGGLFWTVIFHSQMSNKLFVSWRVEKVHPSKPHCLSIVDVHCSVRYVNPILYLKRKRKKDSFFLRALVYCLIKVCFDEICVIMYLIAVFVKVLLSIYRIAKIQFCNFRNFCSCLHTNFYKISRLDRNINNKLSSRLPNLAFSLSAV